MDEDQVAKLDILLTFGAGSSFVAALIAVFYYISGSGSIKDPFLWALMFIGISTGHYLGEALDSKSRRRPWYATSIYGTLGVFLTANTLATSGNIFAPAIMLLFFGSVLLKHYSGLLAENGDLTGLITWTARWGSSVYLTVYVSGFLLPIVKSLPVLGGVATEVLSFLGL